MDANTRLAARLWIRPKAHPSYSRAEGLVSSRDRGGERGKRVAARIALLVCLALLAPAPAALAQESGSPTLTPNAVAFASQAVGTTSAMQLVTLRFPCPGLEGDPGPPPMLDCAPPQSTFDVSVAATGDFVAANVDCPTSLIASSPYVVPSCTVSVAFAPSAAGTRSGMLSVGSSSYSAPGYDTSPTVALSGEAVQAADGSAAVRKCKKRRHKHAPHKKHHRKRKCRKPAGW
jgi:hypothetical protein